MSRITYNADLLKIMSLFENVTRARLKDTFVDNNEILTFVVLENEIGKAIGKKAVNVRKLEFMLKRKIKIVEFNPEVTEFVKNLTYPLEGVEVEIEDDRVLMKGQDPRTKGLLIGRNSQNLRNLENIVKKYFPIKDVKVV